VTSPTARPGPSKARTTKRDLLSISDLAPDLTALLVRASELKQQRGQSRGSHPLLGRNVALIFEKPSTRTRSSFELAVTELGGHAVYLPASEMQLGRGETIADTARVLSRYYDALVYRAFRWQHEEELARWATVPVINALDDREHPCQAVADLLTLHERWDGKFRGRRLAFVGDGNNVLRSLLLGCAVVGLDLTAAIPPAYRPSPEFLTTAQAFAECSGAHLRLVTDPKDAARGADAIYTDVWVSMGDESGAEARKRAFQGYTVDDALLDLARPDAFAMHDLPAHRGLEITDSVMDGPRQAIWDEAENRLHAQKAILELLLAGGAGSRAARRVR
jgi:ornithine carbamoyltransferase